MAKNTPDRALRLYRTCKVISGQKRSYKWGGGHTTTLDRILPSWGLDCSGSSSLALYDSGLFNQHWALVSGGFGAWGAPGKGNWFTVWYSPVHVWIQFHGVGKYWRFDTSPWGDPAGSGPRMRMLPRTTTGFRPRHWPGL